MLDRRLVRRRHEIGMAAVRTSDAGAGHAWIGAEFAGTRSTQQVSHGPKVEKVLVKPFGTGFSMVSRSAGSHLSTLDSQLSTQHYSAFMLASSLPYSSSCVCRVAFNSRVRFCSSSSRRSCSTKRSRNVL